MAKGTENMFFEGCVTTVSLYCCGAALDLARGSNQFPLVHLYLKLLCEGSQSFLPTWRRCSRFSKTEFFKFEYV